ncbi:MAG: tetratricopeptide repeat protein [Ignavibacteria bacterium]
MSKEVKCKNCNEFSILTNEELEAGKFVCPNCGTEVPFNPEDIIEGGFNTEYENGDEFMEETPEEIKKKSIIRTPLTIFIIVIVLGAAGYFAWTSELIPFINSKNKAKVHSDKGNLLFNSQQNNQLPDQKVLQEALDEFTKATELDKDNYEYKLNKGVALAALGKFKESSEEMTKAINLNPNVSEAYLYRALCYLQLGNVQESLPDFDKAIEIDPTNSNAIFYRANTKYQLRDFEGTIQDVNKLLETNPQLPNLYVFRGLCWVNLENKKSACEDFTKAKEMGFPQADSLIKQFCK